MRKIINKIRIFFHKLFRKTTYTTAIDVWDKYKKFSKKDIIRTIILESNKINGRRGNISKKYYNKLRSVSKRQLIRTLILLKRTYTLKYEGGYKDANAKAKG